MGAMSLFQSAKSNMPHGLACTVCMLLQAACECPIAFRGTTYRVPALDPVTNKLVPGTRITPVVPKSLSTSFNEDQSAGANQSRILKLFCPGAVLRPGDKCRRDSPNDDTPS